MHLALLSLLVPDYDAGIAFFVDIMGWELLENTDLGDGNRWDLIQFATKP